jgi:hypothetical protein
MLAQRQDDKHVIPDARGASDPESILNVQSQNGFWIAPLPAPPE